MASLLVLLAALISLSSAMDTSSILGRTKRDTEQRFKSQLKIDFEYSYTSNAKKTCSWMQRRQLDVLTPGQRGEQVVKKSISVVERVLGNTKGILFKIAWMESLFGTHRLTYRPGYYGGIFQVGKKGFQDTQNVRSHPRLIRKFKKIKKAFCIDWRSVSWMDLRKPLYSAIAARLFLSNKPGAIPSTLSGQAKYWKVHYNTKYGKGTVKAFKKRWREYRKRRY